MALLLGAMLCTYFRRSLPCIGKWTLVLFGFLVAGFQAMTHVFVHSQLCKDVELVVVDETTGSEILYDRCSKNTFAYNLTFVTVALGVFTSLLIAFLPLVVSEDAPSSGGDDDDDDDEGKEADDENQENV